MRKCIKTDKAPAAIGPYSQGVQVGNLVYVSGQIPIDPAIGAFAGDDIVTQTHQVLKNVGEVLAAAGTSMDKVVKTTVLLKSMGDFVTVNEIYATYFTGEILPARAAFEVAALPKGALVEIEAIAEVE